MKNVGILLSSGNSEEVPLITSQLIERNVEFSLSVIRGAYIFRIPEKEISKLPTDDSGYYIPVDEESGHSFYEIRDHEEKRLFNYDRHR